MTLPVDDYTVASAVTETMEYVGRAADRGWVARDSGVFAWCSAVPLPTLNGVLIVEPDRAEEHVISSLLDRLAGEGLPYCLQARPDGLAEYEKLIAPRDMAADAAIPLMVLEESDGLKQVADAPGLTVRSAQRHDTPLLVSVGAAGFEVPVDIFSQMLIEAVFDLEGVRGYLGYCDNRPVTTALGIQLGDFVGIFNVSTIPGYRQRGFGAAMTATAALEGLEAGAGWAWLQSSPAGRNVYRHLGFRDLEEWACWIHSP